ncbi:PadR family transcriptional regulator [Chloroflexi bacterium TSY]|nr:PadR family transcriptional regulator [Chloroflexi bacterium TSY]
MSTKYVLLGLLDIMPMSGYDLAQNFQISFNSFWAASYGQIYPTLHKLEEDGLIIGDRQARGKRAQRIVYSLTNAGRRAFRKWVNGPVDSLPFRDPFRLWASNLNVCDPEIAFRNIDEQIKHQTERAEYLEHTVESILNEEHPLIQERVKQLPAEEVEKIKEVRAFVIRELVQLARFEIESAQRIRQYAETLFSDRETT